MKILHLSESDISGGAALAAYRLHSSLREAGLHSQMLVRQKKSSDPSVLGPTSNIEKGISFLRISVDHLPKVIYRNRDSSMFHIQWLPDFTIKKIQALDPDLIHLHWICRGFISIKTLARIQKPIVWTFHDFWPFTGGCHYPSGCDGYLRHCGKCPQLGSRRKNDLSWWSWKRKAKYWNKLNLNIVAPSRWLKTHASKSSLMGTRRTVIIPNGINLIRFRPINRNTAREILNLRKDCKLILFGAVNAVTDQRKGFDFLITALHKLKTKIGTDVELVVFGDSASSKQVDFGLKTNYLGRLHDEISLSLVYASCDVFVCPSREDNLPNTIMESLACATPCVAFNVGGIPEMVEHKKNGYLAEPSNPFALAEGILWVLGNRERWKQLCAKARKKAESDYDISCSAKKMLALYRLLLQ
jgi:glycosyltransferase involved in cell wall biosynthesis